MTDLNDSAPSVAGERRSGVVALAGRPNAGKSTLLNQILGEKVSIVSNKPQTTRNRIVGILNEPREQIVFLDTPGIHKPMHKMNSRMMDHVRSSLSEADVLAAIIDVSEKSGRGDDFVVEMVRQAEGEKLLRVAVLNKIDLVRKHNLLPIMQRFGELGLFDDIVPLSATTGDGVASLVDLLFSRLPPGEPLYPEGDYTTQPERFFAAEIIREKVLHHTMQEIPYSTAVSIERWEEEEGRDLIRIYATIFVERESQKKIVIGRAGEMIKTIGSEARLELEKILGSRIFIDLHVAVHELWREDERFLGELDWPLNE